jgi:hypothetical protein
MIAYGGYLSSIGMAETKRLFRKIPPTELVSEILESIKLEGLQERRWFSRDELSVDEVDEWLPLLEPYYIPCKAKRFLSNITQARLITIIRHILHPHGYKIRTQERMYKSQKTTMYQIFTDDHEVQLDLSGNELIVDFF